MNFKLICLGLTHCLEQFKLTRTGLNTIHNIIDLEDVPQTTEEQWLRPSQCSHPNYPGDGVEENKYDRVGMADMSFVRFLRFLLVVV